MIPRQVALIIPRLGTSQDVELVSARDAISRMLRGAGLDWHDLAATIPVGVVSATAVPPTPSFFDMARACRDLDCGRLSPTEKKFVGEMCRLGTRSPSSRQGAWLAGIFGRLHGRAAA